MSPKPYSPVQTDMGEDDVAVAFADLVSVTGLVAVRFSTIGGISVTPRSARHSTSSSHQRDGQVYGQVMHGRGRPLLSVQLPSKLGPMCPGSSSILRTSWTALS